MSGTHSDRETHGALHDASPIRPLVLIHGFLGSPEDWGAFERALEKIPHAPPTVRADLVDAARRVLASGEGRVTLPRLACALLESLRRDPRLQGGFDAVGYSMGGRVALEWLVHRGNGSERALDIRLMLASADPGIEDAAERSRRAGVDAHLSDRLAAIAADCLPAERASRISSLLADWYAMPMFAPLTATPAFNGILKRRHEDLASGDIARCWSEIVSGCSPGANEPRWDTLQSAGDACMVITGELDARYLGIVRRSSQMGIATRMMKDAGHALPTEQPDALARLTAAWTAQGTAEGESNLAAHATEIQ